MQERVLAGCQKIHVAIHVRGRRAAPGIRQAQQVPVRIVTQGSHTAQGIRYLLLPCARILSAGLSGSAASMPWALIKEAAGSTAQPENQTPAAGDHLQC